MKTVTAIVGPLLYVPVMDGVREYSYMLQPGQSFQISTVVYEQQVILREMQIQNLVSVA